MGLLRHRRPYVTTLYIHWGYFFFFFKSFCPSKVAISGILVALHRHIWPLSKDFTVLLPRLVYIFTELKLRLSNCQYHFEPFPQF